MIRLIPALVFFIFSCAFFSCKKDEASKPVNETLPPIDRSAATGSSRLIFNFNALANNVPLVTDSVWYTNASGDSFTVTKFNYYISNIKLKNEDGTVFHETESYHLVKHAEGITSFTVNDVPAGNYSQVEFLIGVDSIRNISGAQTGALDVANLMFWEWNSGYIFFKLEGDFNTLSQPARGGYAMHIGGFSDPLGCLQKCSFNLSKHITAGNGNRPAITYKVLVDEIFVNPQVIDFTTYYNSVNEKMFKAISDNYRDMFVVDKVEN